MYNRIDLMVDLKLKKVFVSYFTKSPGVPTLSLSFGGITSKNPYNEHRAYIIAGYKDETPEQLIERLLKGDMLYKGRERNVILECLQCRLYTKLIDWME